jgi:hypothetical protein
MIADIVNAALETVGGVLLWLHVLRAWRDGEIKGAHWAPALFFGAWGAWNLFYYPLLGQYLSAAAGVMPLIANVAYLVLYRRLVRK